MPRLSKIGAAALAAFGWTSGAAAVTASYLVVAGGGGGGSNNGGGGGAGGLLTGTTSLNATTTYTVTVGSGGAGATTTGNGNAGSNSQFGTLTAAVGGGYGGGGSSPYTGGNGGSGGGSGSFGSGSVSGGTGTSGQGNNGGGNGGYGSSGFPGGGGGGSGGAGSNATSTSAAGNGGVGTASSITGTSTYYAAGGGGSISSGTAGTGGLGGGGNGGVSVAGSNATANTGSGGGGSATAPASSGNGGSGVVIISYPAPQVFWGGFVTTSGGNIIHTFTTSGSLAPITTSVTANYLQVAGGGAGGGATNQAGQGGGGAGGYLTGTTSLSLASSYTVTVGAGGASTTAQGTNGGNSQFGALTASVGGGGGGGGSGSSGVSGTSGGSGGGGANGGGNLGSGGSATSGQGNAGGSVTSGSSPYGGAGGGGASAAGGNGTSSAGNGGAGTASSISGSSVTYAGGGGGGVRSGGTAGTGGAGGGGNGANTNDTNGSAGTANTGGGGGGSSQNSVSVYGGQGGSGIVIISYPGSQLFGGGIVSFVNGYTIHTFQTSGTLIPIVSLSASYLIVAGGGAGGPYDGGGGGAGGMQTGSGVTIDTNSTYLVTVGAGGAGQTSGSLLFGNNGSNSSFSPCPTASVGGGGGGSINGVTSGPGISGGSGGGGAYGGTTNAGGAGTSGQGNNGGTGGGSGTNSAGGGGGAGAVGGNSVSNTQGGAGGAGLASSISGTSTYYAGGGGGGSDQNPSTQALGGVGGGGNSAYSRSNNGTAGTANTGGGGGGGVESARTGYSGGSGVVIISYPGATQQMAGGTVTISGGNVIHTFNSSGYLAPLKLVNNSLRFRQSNGSNLSRTNTVAGNQKTWTMSFWTKRGKLSYSNDIMGCYSASNDTGNFEARFQNSNDAFYVILWNYVAYTNASFRDPAAWYHVVLVLDTTQSGTSSGSKIKVYVNGVLQSWNTDQISANISQNTNLIWNATTAQYFGRWYASDGGGYYYDGEITEINFIDGQALTPNSFGTFNSYGVWQPITYGGSYGTNGFYLPFDYNGTTSTYGGSFNGTSQYLNFTGNSSLQLSTGSFTIEAWVYGPTQAAYAGITGSSTVTSGWTFRLNNTGNLVLTNGSTTYTSSSTVTINTWTHVAVTRSGTSLYFFINGNAAGTATSSDSIDLTSGTFQIAKGFSVDGASGYFSGSISNLRIVKGTAVYTSSFTPPTSPLTAISGTSLLTLQNATIVDNSTNGFTITNNGTTVTYVGYPFYLNIGKDNGPAGNNWTPNNINSGLPTGSTYDVMTDVPTLTSATAANYCVLNPLDNRSSATISDGNLSFNTGTASGGLVVGTMAASSGKWYVEFSPTSSVANECFFGIENIAYPLTSGDGYVLGNNSTSYAYRNSGQKVNSGSSTSYGSSFTTNDVIGVALDLDAGTLTFYKNGTSQGTAFTGITGTYRFGANDGSGGGGITGVVNFGQQPFVYTPPTNFVALNTYNI